MLQYYKNLQGKKKTVLSDSLFKFNLKLIEFIL
jgi:hypothetical protein